MISSKTSTYKFINLEFFFRSNEFFYKYSDFYKKRLWQSESELLDYS